MIEKTQDITEWRLIQAKISHCNECVSRWPDEVVHPLQIGEIPDPPCQTRVLFIGVAPTPTKGKNKGSHFYTSRIDSLRNGLFSFLQQNTDCNLNSSSIEEGNRKFIELGYFFVHAGKARPISELAPGREALYFCAKQHLVGEIEFLKPKAICFLGKTNLAFVAKQLFGKHIGEYPTSVTLGSWSGVAIVAPQPLRAGKAKAPAILRNLLARV